MHNNPSPPTGNTTSQQNLPLDQKAPVAGVLFNYDTDRDAEPGRVINKGGSGESENDPDKQQTWRTAVLDVNITVSGTATFHVYSAVKDFKGGRRGVVSVFLIDVGAGQTTICQGTLNQNNWQGGSKTWVYRTIMFDCPTYTVAAGHRLAVKVVVPGQADDDMWFAYDTAAYPARLEISAAAPIPAPAPVPGS